ncbi:hypothetical protein QR680_012447 [Steinernema hermaphroditum]|uniref:Uncharacterized protein n=1 Tax=Steinernema hermaphroditum TaxID=289476 RepID=A0AA39I226_9BILA|nr:hypothetical protein QR680_012447 [Steinernema hermaphroditum]
MATSRSLLRLAGAQRRLFCSGKVPQQQGANQATSSMPEKPLYVTQKAFKDTDYKNRFARAMDSSSGQRPTNLQRHFLVITRMFKNRSEIPEYVTHGTMNRMHDRMRVVFIVVASVFFFTFFYGMELINHARIERDKRAGKSMSAMDE